MMAMGVCVGSSGLAGFGLSLALAEGWALGAGLGALALGVVGLAGLVSWQVRSA